MTKNHEIDFRLPGPKTGIPGSNGDSVGPHRDVSVIGPSILVKGDVIGEEDLVIEGRVEGKVDVRQNSITIAKNGRIKADVYGKLIVVEGEVEGKLFGQEQVTVRSSGCVRGNISAPRVSIENGARVKGTIDMDSKTWERPRESVAVESRPSTSAAMASPQTHKAGLALRTEGHGMKVG